MTFRVPLAALAVMACCALVKPASASVVGSLDVANCSGGGLNFSSIAITWLPAGTVAGTGCIDTGAGTSLTYSGGTLGPGVAGNIKNLPSGSDQFMTFSGTTLDFVLTGLGPGSANTVCAGLSIGQSCSVAVGSPFILTSLGTSTVVSLSAFGTVEDGGVTGSWSGAFSTQLHLTPAAIQTTILTGGSVKSTYSGQFDVTSPSSVPEPSTISMLAAGAGLFIALKRRKS